MNVPPRAATNPSTKIQTQHSAEFSIIRTSARADITTVGLTSAETAGSARRCGPGTDRGDEVLRGNVRGHHAEHLLEQHPMNFRIAVRAAVADDMHFVVKIRGGSYG